jgi:hypothetical protein
MLVDKLFFFKFFNFIGSSPFFEQDPHMDSPEAIRVNFASEGKRGQTVIAALHEKEVGLIIKVRCQKEFKGISKNSEAVRCLGGRQNGSMAWDFVTSFSAGHCALSQAWRTPSRFHRHFTRKQNKNKCSLFY